jgi:hypothetical protein
MKKLLLSISLLLTTMAAMAQVPQGINYQAVMRGPSGTSRPSPEGALAAKQP